MVGAEQVAKQDAPNPLASATSPAIRSPAMSAPNSSELAQPFPIEAPAYAAANPTVADMEPAPSSPPLTKTVSTSDPGLACSQRDGGRISGIDAAAVGERSTHTGRATNLGATGPRRRRDSATAAG